MFKSKPHAEALLALAFPHRVVPSALIESVARLRPQDQVAAVRGIKLTGADGAGRPAGADLAEAERSSDRCADLLTVPLS